MKNIIIVVLFVRQMIQFVLMGAAIFCAKIIGDLTYLIDMFLVPDNYPPVALVTGDKICRSIGILHHKTRQKMMVYHLHT